MFFIISSHLIPITLQRLVLKQQTASFMQTTAIQMREPLVVT